MKPTAATSPLTTTPKRTGWWDTTINKEDEKLAVKELLRRTSLTTNSELASTKELVLPVAPAAEPPVVRKKKKTKRPPWHDPAPPVLDEIVESSFNLGSKVPKIKIKPSWVDPVLPAIEESIGAVESSFHLGAKLPKIGESVQMQGNQSNESLNSHGVLRSKGSREDVRGSTSESVNIDNSMQRQRRRNEDVNVDDILRQQKTQDDNILKQRKIHDDNMLEQRQSRDKQLQHTSNLSTDDLHQHSLAYSRSRGSREDMRKTDQSIDRLHADSLILSKQKRKTRSNDTLASEDNFTKRQDIPFGTTQRSEQENIAYNFKTLSCMMRESDFQGSVHFARYLPYSHDILAQYSSNSGLGRPR